MENQSTVNEFILLAFSEIKELQILYFLVFLSIYLVALLGNILIILTIAHDHNLHTPMYFFLANLSLVDACYISMTVPKSMAISLTNDRRISFSGCVSQVLLVFTFASTELFFLTVMAYDRYVAICLPLQYMRIMNWNACLQMAVASWISAIVHATVQTISTFRLQFCTSHVQQFFCDVPKLWRISCIDTMFNEWLIGAAALAAGICCLYLILISCGFIFSTVFKIQSPQGKRKIFSTCTPHLTVISLFLSTAAFSYVRPQALSSTSVDLLSTILYTVLPSIANPIIYSLRNKDIHQAAWKLSNKWFRYHRVVSNAFAKNCKVYSK